MPDAKTAQTMDSTDSAIVDAQTARAKRSWLWSTSQRKTLTLAVGILAVAFAAWFGVKGLGGYVEHEDFSKTNTHKANSFRCNLNIADWAELAQLPGIGETLAKRIIARRVNNGPYADVSQLLEIRGIGEKKLAQLRPYVRIGDER